MTLACREAKIMPMINAAIRYQPILRELRKQRPGWVLDVGSGPEGLRMFWRGAVIGIDVEFKRRPLHQAVLAAGAALPFRDASCPMVVGCDMLEHVAPCRREAVVSEMARVAAGALLLVFPSGEPAMRVYRDLAQEAGAGAPVWLREHLDNGLPDAEVVAGWLRDAGWSVSILWFESAQAHARLLRWELRQPVKLLTYSAMRLFGRWLVWCVPVVSTGPKLRVLIKAEHRSAQAHCGASGQ